MLESFLLCQAIVADLASAAWNPSITPRAEWTVSYEPQDLAGGVLVTLVPSGVRELEQVSRNRDVRMELTASLLIQKKVGDFTPSTLSPLGALQGAISDHLRHATPLDQGAGGLKFFHQPQTVSGLVRRHLEQYRVWTGFLDLKYTLLKD